MKKIMKFEASQYLRSGTVPVLVGWKPFKIVSSSAKSFRKFLKLLSPTDSNPQTLLLGKFLKIEGSHKMSQIFEFYKKKFNPWVKYIRM